MKEKSMRLLNIACIRHCISYLMVGGIASCADFVVSNMTYSFLGVSGLNQPEVAKQIEASLAGIVIGLLLNYFLALKWVFKAQADLNDFLKICKITVAGMLMIMGISKLNVAILHLPFCLFKLGTMGILFIWNYLARIFWVYNKC